jgi:hypothetical protein
MTTRCYDANYSTPAAAGDLGQPWASPANAAADDGALAVSSVDVDAVIADTVTDFITLPVSASGAPPDSRLRSLGLTVRAYSVGSKGTARIAAVRFTCDGYDSGDLASNQPLTTTEQSFEFDLANATTLPTGAQIAAGAQWLVRFGAASGSCAIAVDALLGSEQACFEIPDRGLLGRDFRGRNFRGRG